MSLWAAIVIIVLLVIGGDVLSRWLDRPARRLPAGGDDTEVRELREQVDDLSRRVERLSEEQRFLTRLLEERPDEISGRASQQDETGETDEWSPARTSKAT